MNTTKKSPGQQTIALNKKARHDYLIEECFEAGLVLQGWEVKSLRAGRVQLKDSYVIMKHGEAWLLNVHMSPPNTITTQTTTVPDPERSRKLLLHAKELDFLAGAVNRKGYTLIPLALYWKRNRAKIEFGLAKGKQLHDKRVTEKDRAWAKDKQRFSKLNNR